MKNTLNTRFAITLFVIAIASGLVFFFGPSVICAMAILSVPTGIILGSNHAEKQTR